MVFRRRSSPLLDLAWRTCARPGRLPALHLDNREIIEARLTSPADLDSVLLTGPVAAYLGRAPARVCPRITLTFDVNTRYAAADSDTRSAARRRLRYGSRNPSQRSMYVRAVGD